MKTTIRIGRNCALLLWFLGHGAAASGPAGGISFDGSLGPAATLTGPNYLIRADMGRQVGANLFHSFNQFNLASGETANFSSLGSTGPISTIIARVTGGTSSINGTITSDISGVNLFLLNPAGIIFGANAQVNITGAFATGTPDYIKMADGGVFHTSLGGNDVLTAATVSAFGFVNSAPQPVQFTQSHLAFATGAAATVIGGDITFDGATISAPGGHVAIYSARGAGEVAYAATNHTAPFGVSTVSAFGNVTLQNEARVAIGSAQGGGHVVIRGGVMVVQGGSQVTSVNTGPAAGGSIHVDATALSLLDNSSIQTSASSSGQAGEIDLSVSGATQISNRGLVASVTNSAGQAGDVTLATLTLALDGSASPGFFTGITSATNPGATGAGGHVSVTASGAITIAGGGEISADTYSAGHAGEVTVQAQSLSIDGSASLNFFTGISSACNTGATNDGGSIQLAIAGDLSISQLGEISTSTHGAGNAGNISVQADSLEIAGSPTVQRLTGIATVASAGSGGHGGNITLDIAHDISMTQAGEVSADTRTAASGGDITLHAGSMTLDGSLTPDRFTGVTSSTGSPTGAASTGHGGNISVTIDDLLFCTGTGGIEEQTFSSGNAGQLSVNVGGTLMLSNAGFVAGDTFGNGDAGSVTVLARTIAIDGAGPFGASSNSGDVTGIASNADKFYHADGTGNGGSVSVTATDSISIVNGGEISALTETQGTGGSVNVQAPGAVSVSGAGSKISSSSTNPDDVTLTPGTAGSVTMDVGTLTLDDHGTVATSATAADAGSIDITASDTVNILNGASISTSAGANGGSIGLKVAQLVYLFHGEIDASAGVLKQAGIAGRGGNIVIDPQFVVLDHGLITANAAEGQGGNISIFTPNFLNSNSSITATGSTDGTITISSPDLDLSGSLYSLPAKLVSDENRLRERCARAINHEFSSLIVVGRGGTEAAPEELQPDFGTDAEVR